MQCIAHDDNRCTIERGKRRFFPRPRKRGGTLRNAPFSVRAARYRTLMAPGKRHNVAVPQELLPCLWEQQPGFQPFKWSNASGGVTAQFGSTNRLATARPPHAGSPRDQFCRFSVYLRRIFRRSVLQPGAQPGGCGVACRKLGVGEITAHRLYHSLTNVPELVEQGRGRGVTDFFCFRTNRVDPTRVLPAAI